jgi:hypothetical protein
MLAVILALHGGKCVRDMLGEYIKMKITPNIFQKDLESTLEIPVSLKYIKCSLLKG